MLNDAQQMSETDFNRTLVQWSLLKTTLQIMCGLWTFGEQISGRSTLAGPEVCRRTDDVWWQLGP